ncbi:Peptide methionine sulfoxide reductase A5 [Vitis vinifera]|uniref:peptide-methionine (S)-S-oxide reductase n=1 Tax=Vitis vinifera TaxID=29760 RepID=A0A438K679_VITVI|nr:Peptide methionine sulfoxide reductase A5 [Vitis vinifera]RVX16696.1 Peptide methionine sulfoxide reductase A5 [Vitis vinifera]
MPSFMLREGIFDSSVVPKGDLNTLLRIRGKALAFGGKANEMTFSGRHVSLPYLRIICSVVLIILTAERAVSIRFPDRISESVKASSNQPLKTAVFALGSFWRSEAVFGCLDGVVRTTAGYAGGSKANPEYRSWGDHAESVQV